MTESSQTPLTLPSLTVPVVEWQPAIDFAAQMFSNALEFQRLQAEWFSTWCGSTSAMQRELWDSWTSHFAGGVPIDG